jgi:hypothetical protein
MATRPLFVIILSLIIDDIEESELVDALRSGDDSEPVSQLLLIEDLIGTEHDSHQHFCTLMFGMKH